MYFNKKKKIWSRSLKFLKCESSGRFCIFRVPRSILGFYLKQVSEWKSKCLFVDVLLCVLVVRGCLCLRVWVSICVQNKEYVLVFEWTHKRAVSILCVFVFTSGWIQTQSYRLLFFEGVGGEGAWQARFCPFGLLVCVLMMMLVPKTKPAAVFTGSHTNPFIGCHLRPPFSSLSHFFTLSNKLK